MKYLAIILAVMLMAPVAGLADTWDTYTDEDSADKSTFFVRSIQGEFRNDDDSDSGARLIDEQIEELKEKGFWQYLGDEVSGSRSANNSNVSDRESRRDSNN